MSVKRLITSTTKLKGEITVPGDKSISHRAVMFGSIADGITHVQNFLPGEDCLSSISCFRSLGAEINQNGSEVIIVGKGLGGLKKPEKTLYVGNSGTTIRLMLGILSGLPFESSLEGDESIAKRPMTRVTIPLSEMGADISGRNKGEFTPLTVKGQKLKGITYELPVASAQVKSAILLAGMQAEGTTTVVEPVKTRDHTERMIIQFGGSIERTGDKVVVNGGQNLVAANIVVPGDISSAAFFLAAGAIIPESEILLKNVGLNPTRTGIIDVLKAMGADITIEPYENGASEPAGDIRVTYSELQGTTVEGELIPRLIDEIPVIALLATQANGRTIIKDAAELKVKETNRIDTVVNELSKLGAKIEATEDGMIIDGKTNLKGGTVSAHGDHRIGMMLSIAALLCSDDVTLEQSDSVSVSYPGFFGDLYSLI
ncbi:3-phosphoshikimate 1-carboxyvinyltransferase [Mesobacillus subterraneus]|jgi:3-phosphoshikimate 1-carboxyvinyltransferase|uniref:3-phosphoshikimate 1-carboxyvinyltransferase n=1 Tax=Mesobacillus subterraneus TaxID=285983 RepID=UPI00203F696A|nr:3-phosphoshikimate 1-carboxyvinyltransferase [Mesobacillus subterraneus]MCM3666655.1 3-phosphoshikimate 1-carboxyvinyltransferase [Mesobacillus subterraneus]MCM3682525.1 3-phosphoshikimate 1-carboxyvinyltransferase [Mesobacillus subterraneus]